MPHPGHPLHLALYHYYCEFDAPATIARFAAEGLEGTPGALTNFMGLKIPVQVFPPVLASMDGQVEGPPDPGNWHADIAEWTSALYAVQQAAPRGHLRVMELGCGWACWLGITGSAARRLGLPVSLIGVEGDANHLANARAMLALNDFPEDSYRLVHGIAAPARGQAIFPGPKAGEAGWGGEAIFDADEQTLKQAEQDPTVQVLDCYPLGDLSGGEAVDLLHIDIQGAEADFVSGNMADMQAHVRRVLIGTHSRAIEGRLMTLFEQAGWRMEMDRPAIAPLHGGRPQIHIDGVQMWANPDLA